MTAVHRLQDKANDNRGSEWLDVSAWELEGNWTIYKSGAEAMTFILYGIKNCDTVKKARKWLDEHRVEYRFHDFRSDGVDVARIQRWLDELGADTIINRRGTTFRQLDTSDREVLAGNGAAALLARQPTLIKRPVLDLGHQRVIGFSSTLYQDTFRTHTL